MTNVAPRPGYYHLTLTEQRVVRMLPERLTTNVMAEQLAISPHTVKSHLRKVGLKWGVSGAREILLVAYEQGIVPPPDCPEVRRLRQFVADVAELVDVELPDLSLDRRADVLAALRTRLAGAGRG